ncbi:MAG TPA: DNA polymerase III subunit delta [Alphaproteobacteria bacterium]|nr:DNA polymerase III subunit delta [Alphaproteobacteria bacterium]
MKLTGAAIERFLSRPDPAVRAVVVYGGDEGLVRERAAQLGRTVVPDLNDPFQVAVLAADAIAADPALLADEAAAMSLMGGRRLIRIRDGSDKITKALTAMLEAPAGDSLTVIEAGDLASRSALRKLVEGAVNAAAMPCYVEDEAGLARTLAAQIAETGKSIDPDAMRLLASSLVGDRMLARGELDKLLLYMGDARTITLDDVAAAVVDTATLGMDDAIRAALDGNFQALDRCLARLAGEGTGGVALLRVAQIHFRRLHVTRARIDAGAPADRALSQLQPPLFFKARDAFAADVARWSLTRIQAALDRLVEAEAGSKRTGANDTLLAADALLSIARAAAGTKNRAAHR